MAERLFALRARQAAGAAEVVTSDSVGTGDWHVGEWMNPPAAHQIELRGGDSSNYAAATVDVIGLRGADLILGAATEHVSRVIELAPDMASRAFLLREFADLVTKVDPAALPSVRRGTSGSELIADVRTRGVGLVKAAHALRADEKPDVGYDVDDPWSRDEETFMRVADEIDEAVTVIAKILLGVSQTGVSVGR